MSHESGDTQKTHLLRNVAIATAAGLAFGGGGSVVKDAYDEHQASKQVVSAMNRVTPKDLVRCDITSVEPGPPVDNYYGKRAPSLKITYDAGETKKAQKDKWLRDEGTTVNGDHYEVQWFQKVDVQHHIGKMVLPGTVLSVKDARRSDGDQAFSAFDGLRVAPGTMVVPLNVHHQGQRTVEPGVFIEDLNADGHTRDVDPTKFYESCGRITVDVVGSGIHIESAQDSNRQPVDVR